MKTYGHPHQKFYRSADNTWDSQNRLVSCIINGNTSTYTYGADGLRRQSTKNGVSTDYAYDGTMLVREGHATGGTLTASTVTATYLIGARGPEYRRDDTAFEMDSQGRTVTKARWYVFDGLGSVVGEVDPSGNLTSSPKYDVYGAVRSNSGTASSKQGFVGSLGHVSDDTGLVYMRARYYDPNEGRFISQDASGTGVNWFVYCDNNPVNKIDADGKSAIDIFAAVGGILLGMLLSKVFRATIFLAFMAFVASDLADLAAGGNTLAEETAVKGILSGISLLKQGYAESVASFGALGGPLVELLGLAVGYSCTLILTEEIMNARDQKN